MPVIYSQWCSDSQVTVGMAQRNLVNYHELGKRLAERSWVSNSTNDVEFLQKLWCKAIRHWGFDESFF